MFALWKLQQTPNRICDLQQIAHEMAHEIARVTSPLELGWVTAQMTSSQVMLEGAEKTPRGVIPSVCVKYRRTSQEERGVH
jgi:hypothetical protein